MDYAVDRKVTHARGVTHFFRSVDVRCNSFRRNVIFRPIVSFDCGRTFDDKPKSIDSPKSAYSPKIPLSLQNVKMSEVPIKKAKLDDDDRTEEKVEESETVQLTPEQQTKLDIELLDACRDNASIVNVRGLIESGAGLG